jgi:transcriptional repressor NF-X1
VRAAAAMSNGHSTQRSNAPLDPSAPSFAPPTVQLAAVSIDPQHSTPVTASSSRASSDAQGQQRERADRGGRHGGRGDRNARGGRGGNSAVSATQARSEPTAKPGISSRRAAFEQQTKLTTAISRTSDGSGGAARRLSVDQEQVKEYRAKHRKREKEAEKDDLISRLTRGLGRKPFLECPIVCPFFLALFDDLPSIYVALLTRSALQCFNSILPSQPIWSCLPPTSPPEGDTPANYYTACYTPFHLNCLRDWANRNLVEDAERLRQAGKEDAPEWRCPGCQKRRADKVGGYKCFCGRLSQPPTTQTAPHSCGESCARQRPGCDHACPL